MLGATLVAFSGYLIVGSSWYGHSTNIMFIVMLLLGLELLFVKNQWWLLPIPTLFLLGPSLLFTAEFAVLYTIMRFSLTQRISLASIGLLAKKMIIPVLFGILFLAPFLGTTVYKFIYSPRVGGDMSFVDSLSSRPIFDLAPAKQLVTVIYRFFSNDILGTAANFGGWNNYLEAPLFYCGMITLLLVPQLFLFLKRRQKVVFSAVLSLWILMLIFPYFRYAFYFFVGDYFKSAISLFLPLTCIIMATTAFHFVLKEGKVNVVLLSGTLVLLLGFLYLTPTGSLTSQIDTSLRNMAAVSLVLQAALLLVLHFSKNVNVGLLILVMTLLQGTYFSSISINSRQAITSSRMASKTLYNDYTIEALEYLKRIDPGFYRIEKTFPSVMSGLNDSQVQNFYGTRSYRSHNHNNYVRFLTEMELLDPSQEVNTRWLMGFPQLTQLHPLFGIKYLISTQETKSEVSKFFYEDLGELNGLELFKAKYFIPFGIPITKFSTISDLRNSDTFFKKIQLHYLSVILDESVASLYPKLERLDMRLIHGALAFESYEEAYAEKAMKIKKIKQSRIQGTITLDEPAMVFYSIPYDEGWQAYVNGKKMSLVEVNNGLTGLYLEAGDYDIDLRYRPPFYTLGWILFAVGFLAYITIIVRQRRFDANTSQEALLPPSLE
jgi:uncharacterized membrane protein YfhO